jgi:ELWxxDGT repeat protein
MLNGLRRFLGGHLGTSAQRTPQAGLTTEILEERSLPSASLISNINATGSSLPQNLVPFGGFVYFTANDGVHGRELWRTDGTSAGTTLVADIAPGSADSDPQWLTPVGAWLYFSAFRPDVGVELWRTNGTVTELVADIRTGTASSNPTWLTAVGPTWHL